MRKRVLGVALVALLASVLTPAPAHAAESCESYPIGPWVIYVDLVPVLDAYSYSECSSEMAKITAGVRMEARVVSTPAIWMSVGPQHAGPPCFLSHDCDTEGFWTCPVDFYARAEGRTVAISKRTAADTARTDDSLSSGRSIDCSIPITRVP